MRDTKKLCHSDICEELPPNSHKNSQTNTSVGRLMHKWPSPGFFTRINQFKQLYAETHHMSRETTDNAKERRRLKLGKEWQVGQKVLRKNFTKKLNISKKMSFLRSGPYTVLRKIANTLYEMEVDENPGKALHSHRNHLIDYFPKDASVPSMNRAYNSHQETPGDHSHF